jgi:integrase
MPVTLNKLTETAVKAAKPHSKPRKLSDGGGLYLLLTPEGGRWWRFSYRFGGKEKLLSMGTYPDVPLKLARERRGEARELVAKGIDPSARRQAEKAVNVQTGDANNFRAVSTEWLAMRERTVKAGDLSAATVDRDRRQLETWVHPYIGDTPVDGIETKDLLAALKRIEAEGKHDTCHRARETCERVFTYAIGTGRRTKHNPAVAELFRGTLASRGTTNYAAITEPAKVGALLRAIEGLDGQPTTHAALRIAPYVFVRPGELRAAEWGEFDLDEAEWRIPAERMKMKDPHVVPLARQVVATLRELKKLTGRGKYLFPAIGSSERPLSENTLNGALRRLGYSSDEMTPHGFRSMASTLLNEEGFPPDVIELQLAHKERNSVRAAYNRATRLPERKKMMQAYADRLDELRRKDERSVK